MVAGGALAGVPVGNPSLVVAALGSAALYAGGVALNDAFDVEKDRVLHPDRPLPSGAVSVGAAKAAGSGLLLLGILSGLPQGAAGVAAAALLAGAIVLYDVLPDSAGLASAVVLGFCRALNLARGGLSAEAFPFEVLPFAALHFCLVFCITVISLGEDRPEWRRAAGWAAAVLPFLYAGPPIAAFRREEGVLAILVLVAAAELALWVVRPARRADPAVVAVVPRAVFTLTLLGALYCVAVREIAGAVALVVLFVLSRVAARLIAQRGS